MLTVTSLLKTPNCAYNDRSRVHDFQQLRAITILWRVINITVSQAIPLLKLKGVGGEAMMMIIIYYMARVIPSKASFLPGFDLDCVAPVNNIHVASRLHLLLTLRIQVLSPAQEMLN